MYIRSRKKTASSGQALPLDRCYAKTITTDDGIVDFGLPILHHSLIVGEVAKQLVSFFPSHLQEAVFLKGSTLIAASHDIGKINPLFLKKLYEAVLGEGVALFPELANANPMLEKNTGYHWGVSQATLMEQYPTIAPIVGRHHGTNPKITCLANDPIIGGSAWQSQREQFLRDIKEHFDERFPVIESIHNAAVIAGLVTVSDWIGSGNIFQDLQTLDLKTIPSLAASAIAQAGFQQPAVKQELQFEEIFGFPPRASQKAFYNLVSEPGTYVLEALMGEGKTEAALYAAYKMLASGKNTGIYFALPTKLTSENMYKRMEEFLTRILVSPADQSTLLLHGTAWLFENELGEEGDVGGSWFNSSKRRILAPFGVGTLDQALLSVLHVKHGFVRSFGLAGKVVILDEVHSYDAYTGMLLQYLITHLRELGCTVILLSATLTHQRKSELIDSKSSEALDGYPLITTKVDDQTTMTLAEGPPQRVCKVVCSNDFTETIAQARASALAGMQILWIENTVNEAQQTFKHFAAWGQEAGVEAGLLHARFSPIHRSEIESYWVDLYGKNGSNKRKEHGRILVGTQVLEQSLDIDADLLITRLAPSDMILQRSGRVWRHRQNDVSRPAGSEMSIVVLLPKVEKYSFNPLYDFGPSGVVYDPYVLWRTYQEWKDKKQIVISDDVRPILERTYAERIEEGKIAAAKQALLKNKENLHRFAFNSMATSGETYDDDSAQTRYSELPTVPVLLLIDDSKSGFSQYQLLDGSTIDPNITSKTERKAIAIKILKNIIQVPSYIAPEPLSETELHWLKGFHYIAREPENRLRAARLHPSGSILSMRGGEANEQYSLTYSTILGYVASKNKEEKW